MKSCYSFLEGASQPDELVARAAELELSALSVVDRDGVYGVVRAHMAHKELAASGRRPPRLLLGAELTVLDASAPPTPFTLAGTSKLVLLAETRRGYGALTRLLTLGHARAESKGSARVTWDEIREAAGHLVALAPDAHVVDALAPAYRGSLYAMITRHLRPEEPAREERLRDAAARWSVATVAATEVLYHDRSRRLLSDVLACTRHRVTLATAGKLLRPNAEHALLDRESFSLRFADDPESVARTLEVAERCTFTLDALRYRYPAEKIPSGETPRSWLRALTMEGARQRYPRGIPDEALAQIERELSLVEELEYDGYFLTMWDVVRFCREQNILCQGRGSAANSIVCFCLGITAIDPVRMDLLFERFLSRERAEPPDIDVDIEHERREEVIQYVYARWGRRYAAMVANVIRYRLRSALRDVGKTLDLPEVVLDRASKVLGAYAGDLSELAIREAGLDPAAPTTRALLSLVAQIQDFPRHLGIHPGGFLLGHEPVDTLCPVEPATMEARTVVQWDKQDIEDLGLFKVDLLGLGCLTMVHGAFDLLREHEEIDLDIATVPAEDPTTYAMISRGDTVGVFQIESRAQMSMLPRLAPRTFYDLVIEVAIVRPGPIQGDMVHPYLRRRAGEEEVSFPHPKLERVLKKTLGVPIFQEQVMKLAVEVAGYTPGEADQLRRDMAAWRSKGRIEKHEHKLVSRMIADGIPEEFARRVFNQIKGFGEYGFPESHAASFALLAYVTAWLRCHHPAVFACALLNAQPMGFYAPSTIVDDAKRHGVVFLPIDARRSAWDCTLEAVKARGWGIRMGLRYVRGLGEREKKTLAAARADGAFVDLPDLVRRARLGRRALTQLAEAGALGSFGIGRRRAIWDVRELALHDPRGLPIARAPDPARGPRFAALGSAETIAWDYRASSHSVRGHPMEELRDRLAARGYPDARALAAMRDGVAARYAGMVICRQRPGTATGVTFMTLEDETGFANVVIWRDVFERHEVVGRTAALLEVSGKVQAKDGVVHLVADTLRDLGRDEELLRDSGGAPRSRDFH